MAHRAEAFHRANGILQLGVLEAAAGRFKFAIGQDGIVRADQAHLERARAGIDDEYVQAVP